MSILKTHNTLTHSDISFKGCEHKQEMKNRSRRRIFGDNRCTSIADIT